MTLYDSMERPPRLPRVKGEAMWPDILRLFEERRGVTLSLGDLMELTDGYYERTQLSSCVRNLITSNKRGITGDIQVLARGVYRLPTEAQKAEGIPPKLPPSRRKTTPATDAALHAIITDQSGQLQDLRIAHRLDTVALDQALVEVARLQQRDEAWTKWLRDSISTAPTAEGQLLAGDEGPS